MTNGVRKRIGQYTLPLMGVFQMKKGSSGFLKPHEENGGVDGT